MQKKTGLVLSGGGYRGAFELGILRFFNEKGFKVDEIAGASAGALFGAFHLAGIAPERVLETIKSITFFKLTNYARGLPGFININKFRTILAHQLPATFEELSGPLYVTATNLLSGRNRTFSSGPLIDPLLASAAFPFVFSPVQIGAGLYSDGGILNNFPVEAVRNSCDVVIGVNVNPLEYLPRDEIRSAINVYQRAYELAIRSPSLRKKADCDLILELPSGKYGTFDSSNLNELYMKGYEIASDNYETILKITTS